MEMRWIDGGRATLTAALMLAALPAALGAQGFGIYEQGTCEMGRAGAAVADPCGDASAVFFNPAALTGLERPTLSAGLTGIFTDGAFRADDGTVTELDNRPIPVPHAFVGIPLDGAWSAGLGVYAPYGLETRWPVDGFEGRFIGYDNALRTVYVQPTVAWDAPGALSVGAGLVGVWSEVRLTRRLDLSRTPVPDGLGAPPGATFGDLGIPGGTDFADVTLDGSSDGLGLGLHVSLLLDVSDRVRLGARYLSSVEVDYDGDADFEAVDPGITLGAGNPFGAPAGTPLSAVLEGAGVYAPSGPLADQAVTTAVTMPDQMVVGAAVDATPDVTLSADYQYTRWRTFDTVRIDFASDGTPTDVMVEDYEDTSTLRLGAEWRASPEVDLRGGYVWNQAASPEETVTPILPEASRDIVSAGVGWTPGAVGIDVGYMYLMQDDRRGRVRDPAPGAGWSPDLNSGSYGFDAHLLGLTVTLEL